MDQTYRAFVKPLVFHSIDSEWTSLANLYTSHPVLDEIIKKIVFHTASNESDNPQLVAGYSCGVLMHAPADNLAMCRTGVLVVKENDGWMPIVVKFKGQPYIVECKGVGSGVGGYGSVHSRIQAGTFGKMHVRVTGGMTQESVQKEFESLMAVNSCSNFDNEAIRPFACTLFDYVIEERCIHLGLILRLSPSNIRYSYGAFGSFNEHVFNSIIDSFPLLYSINQQLLQSGFRHQNLNANNLCYLKKDQFIITDYEEVDSIYQVPDSLDVDTQSMPLYHRIYPFRYLNKGQWNGQDVGEFFDYDTASKEVASSFSTSHARLEKYYELSSSIFK